MGLSVIYMLSPLFTLLQHHIQCIFCFLWWVLVLFQQSLTAHKGHLVEYFLPQKEMQLLSVHVGQCMEKRPSPPAEEPMGTDCQWVAFTAEAMKLSVDEMSCYRTMNFCAVGEHPGLCITAM